MKSQEIRYGTRLIRGMAVVVLACFYSGIAGFAAEISKAVPSEKTAMPLKAMPEKVATDSTQGRRAVLPEWVFQPGPLNLITDVPGVQVGHVTIRREGPRPLRTGVTAIVPHSGNLATQGLWASTAQLNGNGEETGRGPLEEDGVLNSPILLTNTTAVGVVHHGVFEFYEKHYPGQWHGQLPVVAECWDGFYSSINDLNAVASSDAVRAIENAQPGRFPQGRVGAGTGMRSYEVHAGIGSASRIVEIAGKAYTVGVLVNTNHSRLKYMNRAVKSVLELHLGPLETLKQRDDQDRVVASEVMNPSTRQGSIIVAIATDAPLMPLQLQRLARRAGLGIGAMGSTMDITSGDFAVAFSTAAMVPLQDGAPAVLPLSAIHPDQLSPLFRATVEAVTEAQMNAILASHRSGP